jgi:hypothetical protein
MKGPFSMTHSINEHSRRTVIEGDSHNGNPRPEAPPSHNLSASLASFADPDSLRHATSEFLASLSPAERISLLSAFVASAPGDSIAAFANAITESPDLLPGEFLESFRDSAAELSRAVEANVRGALR